jgi:hypothetical protein
MVTWIDLMSREPELAAEGRDLLYQFGVGLAFLATVRRDGGPRVHPMCPVISDEGMFAFIVPSPKQADLVRDGGYALHTFPCPDNEDAFYVTGRATLVRDADVREALAQQFVAERSASGVPMPSTEDALFAFDVETCLLTRTTGHGDPSPAHRVWHASS